MPAEVKMVVVNGVRYRPEDAPETPKPEIKSRVPQNKQAPKPDNK